MKKCILKKSITKLMGFLKFCTKINTIYYIHYIKYLEVIFMKKTWMNPEIEALEVAATASGNIENLIPDGKAVWDETANSYTVTVGKRQAS